MGINFAQRAAVSKMSLQTFAARRKRAAQGASRRLPPAGPGRGARRLGRRPEGVSIAAAPSQVSSDGRRLNQPAGARAPVLLRAAAPLCLPACFSPLIFHGQIQQTMPLNREFTLFLSISSQFDQRTDWFIISCHLFRATETCQGLNCKNTNQPIQWLL